MSSLLFNPDEEELKEISTKAAFPGSIYADLYPGLRIASFDFYAFCAVATYDLPDQPTFFIHVQIFKEGKLEHIHFLTNFIGYDKPFLKYNKHYHSFKLKHSD